MKTAPILVKDGATLPLSASWNSAPPPPPLLGTANQIELGSQIRGHVQVEFDRVAGLLLQSRDGRSHDAQARAALALSILEEKRREVMAHDRAGYFIQSWQEFGGRLRRWIVEDPRYRLAVLPQASETK